jgi:hypothetical protein
MVPQLSDEPEEIFASFLRSNWDPANTLGYDPTVTDTSADAFLPLQTSIDDVGAVYPSVVVTYSNQTVGGQTGYTFMSSSGPGKDPDGTCLATVRAEDDSAGYTGDSGTYSAVDAEAIAHTLLQEVERVIGQNPVPSNDFDYQGVVRGPDIPDDDDPSEGDIVRLRQTQLRYGFVQDF